MSGPTRVVEWVDQVTGEDLFVVENADTNEVLGVFDYYDDAHAFESIYEEYEQ